VDQGLNQDYRITSNRLQVISWIFNNNLDAGMYEWVRVAGSVLYSFDLLKPSKIYLANKVIPKIVTLPGHRPAALATPVGIGNHH
jgi:hypothetical protein